MAVATDHTTIEESGTTYAITGDLQTTGLAGVFQKFQSKSSAHGKLGGSAGAQPEAYKADVRRDKDERHDRWISAPALPPAAARWRRRAMPPRLRPATRSIR
jgi:hypothetical protein